MQAFKQSIIDDLVAKIKESPFLIVADYGGLTVAQFEELRNKLREGGSEVHVTKNSFVKRAAAAVEYPEDIATAPDRPDLCHHRRQRCLRHGESAQGSQQGDRVSAR